MGMNVKKTMGTICYHVFVCAFGLVMIYPVLWMITGSLKNNTEILNGSLGLIPPNWRWDNYATGWRGFGGVGFGNFFRNSFIVTVISTAATVISSGCVAYAFARIKYKGRNIWFCPDACDNDAARADYHDSSIYHLQ